MHDHYCQERLPGTHVVKCTLFVRHVASLLNQARRAWFLKIDLVWIVGMRVRVCACVCVCLRPRLLITSGMICRDVNLIQLVEQVLQLLYGNYNHYR